jgi:hypothetical protein
MWPRAFRRCKGGSAPFFIEFKWAEFLRERLPRVLLWPTAPTTLPHKPALLFLTRASLRWSYCV